MWNDARAFFASLRYDHPHLIGWVIPAAILTGVLCLLWWQTRRSDLSKWGTPHLVARFTSPLPNWIGVVIGILLVLSVVCGFAAATMPYQPEAVNIVPAGSLRVVAVADTSISMGAVDNGTDQQLFGGKNCAFEDGPCGRRIDIGRLMVLNQIMTALQGKQLGMEFGNQLALVIYSGGPVVRSFLTDDFDPLRQILTTWKWVDIGGAIGRGSFVDLALLKAVEVLQHDKPRPGQPVQDVILLIHDGGNDSSDDDLVNAEKAMKKQGARLVIVLVGKPARNARGEPCNGEDETCGSPIPLWDDDDKPMYEKDGQRAYFKAEDGAKAFTARDDAFAERLARETGGTVIKVTPGQPLDVNWPTAMLGEKAQVGKHYVYHYAVAASMFMLALAWLAPWWLLLFHRKEGR
jgi:hypothetical protein